MKIALASRLSFCQYRWGTRQVGLTTHHNYRKPACSDEDSRQSINKQIIFLSFWSLVGQVCSGESAQAPSCPVCTHVGGAVFPSRLASQQEELTTCTAPRKLATALSTSLLITSDEEQSFIEQKCVLSSTLLVCHCPCSGYLSPHNQLPPN